MEPKREDIDSSTFKDSLPYSKKQLKFNRKGQVTIFIIVGIIILAAAAAVFFVTRTTVTERLTAEGEPVIEVPTEFVSIKQFTENCLTDVGKQGLLVLGEQGGYIYPDLVGKYSVSDPTDSDGLNLEPLKVPFWHYNPEPNAGNKVVFSSLQPKLYAKEDKEMSIESQLGRFVNEKLDGCLQGYQAIKKQGYDVEVLSLPDVEVHVTDGFVQFWLTMDVDAQLGENKHSFDRFFVKVPLKLKKYYEVASAIAAAEQEHLFLEQQGINLIQVYGQADAQKIPPTTAVTFEPVSVNSWGAADIREKFKSLLTSQIPVLRYLSGSNFYRHQYPVSDLSRLYQKNYDNMIIPLQNAEGVEITFDYFGWEPFVDVNEGEKEIAPTDYAWEGPFSLIPFSFNFQEYYNTYDVSFPVLASVRDPAAFDGKGYLFTLALEANIRNNFPAKAEEIEPPVQRVRQESLVCDENKRTTELVKTVVVDSFTQEPIEAVKINFAIPEQDTCMMGVTDQQGQLESKYPAVYGGVVNFIKTDYLTNFYPLDTYEFQQDQQGANFIGYAVAGRPERVVEMHKIKSLPVTVRKKEVNKCVTSLKCKYTSSGGLAGVAGLSILPYKDISCSAGPRKCFFNSGESLFTSSLAEPVVTVQADASMSRTHNYYFTGSTADLDKEEQAFLTLERVGDINPAVVGDDFSATVSVQGSAAAEVQLVPGIYKVTGLLTLNREIRIPDDYRCFSYTIVSYEKEECNTISGSTLGSYVTGGLRWDTPETYITITPEQLYTAKELELYVLNYEMSDVDERFTGQATQCAGVTCAPVVGCLFEACDDEDIPVNGLVLEDLQVPGKLEDISQSPAIRQALEPTFR